MINKQAGMIPASSRQVDTNPALFIALGLLEVQLSCHSRWRLLLLLHSSGSSPTLIIHHLSLLSHLHNLSQYS